MKTKVFCLVITVYLLTAIPILAQSQTGTLTHSSDTVTEYTETFLPRIIDNKTLEFRVPFMIPYDLKDQQWYKDANWKFHYSIAVCEKEKDDNGKEFLTCDLKGGTYEAEFVRRDDQYFYYQGEIPRLAKGKIWWGRAFPDARIDNKRYAMLIDDLSRFCRLSSDDPQVTRFPNKPGYEWLADLKGEIYKEKIIPVPPGYDRRP